MEIKTIKCTSKEDGNIEAISYCGECKIYMCNKCEKFHSKLFFNHQTYNLDKQIEDIFTAFCKEPKHRDRLDFFCKDHNILCCTACLCKINKNGVGKHKDCNVCLIEDIKEEKKIKIKENIKYLEEISETIQDSIKNLKIINEKIIKNKEELKLEIQKIFTKIRTELNNREDELLLKVDEKFNNIYFDENIFKQCEKLPNNIKLSLEKGKKIDFNENNLALFINECINIENNIKNINKINDNINKYKMDNNIEIEFDYKEELNTILENIKKFGNISLLNNTAIDSQIINENKNKLNSIINWIREKINKNNIRFEKIFIMSKNGISSKDFHNYCDNKGPTLIIVKTTKNKIFGGFTPLDWENRGGNKYDKNNQTFLFSLNSMEKYDMIDIEKEAIYCSEEYGPIFGGSDFQIESDMNNGSTYANKFTNFLSNENLVLTGGKGNNESFEIEDFEVFKVIY